ncbi:MAG TPA: hypothetical protein IAB45_04785 [Candidatus Onthousia faecavium]|nr:hypothetical protein [Candidatus Onthousia faecavium]
MLDVIKFYFDLIGELISQLWGNFQLTENVNFLQFFVAIIIILTFISVLRFGFGSNGISEFKQFSRNKEKERNGRS